ncbi:MAG TPA: hypothetical protein VKS20_15725 [Candidatus Acidoferrales bacterium]|nr:hypothetical protein [Candidatus Acidoferrales bacterium]
MKSAMRTPRRTRKRQPRPSPDSNAWVLELASPYLKGYIPVAARERGLKGYWFLAGAPAESKSTVARNSLPRVTKAQFGFFVGYLTEGEGKFAFLHPEPPECLVFAWLSPVNGALHQQLVRQQRGLVRKTFEYIRWLTHRPPRFVFHEGEAAAMARHASMKGWPIGKREHLSRNFFIETLAWLVRSGLVRKLREEAGKSR